MDKTNKISEMGAMLHMIKSAVGTGILSLPFAFKSAGLLMGTIGLIISAVICTFCCHMVLQFHTVMMVIFSGIITVTLFLGYYSSLSMYSIIISMNLDKLISYYWIPINLRIYMTVLVVPFLLICYIPNWKYLTPISSITNLFMASSMGIIIYFFVKDLPKEGERDLVASVLTIPTFFGLVIFSLQCIGVILPLRNNMKNPTKFLGMFGVLNRGVFIMTMAYFLVGFLGYFSYGDATAENITINLPSDSYTAQAVQILVTLSVFGAYGVQCFISLDLIWNKVEHRIPDNKMTLMNYVIRTCLVIVATLVALAVPSISPFVSLIGAFCFSIAGILAPVTVYMLTFWNDGFGKYHWIGIRHFLIILFGVCALIFGSITAITDIITLYST